MASLLPAHPAFHAEPQGLLGPGFSRDLCAALAALTLWAGAQGAVPVLSVAAILVLTAGIALANERPAPRVRRRTAVT